MDVAQWIPEAAFTTLGASVAWVIRVERKLAIGEQVLQALNRLEDKVDRIVERAAETGRNRPTA